MNDLDKMNPLERRLSNEETDFVLKYVVGVKTYHCGYECSSQEKVLILGNTFNNITNTITRSPSRNSWDASIPRIIEVD